MNPRAVIILFLLGCAGWLRKPDGGVYWALRPPVEVTGDGPGHESGYRFHHIHAGYPTTPEIGLICDRYWITPQRASENFYHVVPPATVSCYDSTQTTTEFRDNRVYDVIRLRLPEGQRTLYFDVTGFKQQKSGCRLLHNHPPGPRESAPFICYAGGTAAMLRGVKARLV